MLHDLKTTCRGVRWLSLVPLGLKIPDSFKVNSFKLARIPYSPSLPPPPPNTPHPWLDTESGHAPQSNGNGGVGTCPLGFRESHR